MGRPAIALTIVLLLLAAPQSSQSATLDTKIELMAGDTIAICEDDYTDTLPLAEAINQLSQKIQKSREIDSEAPPALKTTPRMVYLIPNELAAEKGGCPPMSVADADLSKRHYLFTISMTEGAFEYDPDLRAAYESATCAPIYSYSIRDNLIYIIHYAPEIVDCTDRLLSHVEVRNERAADALPRRRR